MNRREMLASASVLSTMMLSGVSFADEKKSEKTNPISKEKLKKVTDAAFDCIKKGEACTAHSRIHGRQRRHGWHRIANRE